MTSLNIVSHMCETKKKKPKKKKKKKKKIYIYICDGFITLETRIVM